MLPNRPIRARKRSDRCTEVSRPRASPTTPSSRPDLPPSPLRLPAAAAYAFSQCPTVRPASRHLASLRARSQRPYPRFLASSSLRKFVMQVPVLVRPLGFRFAFRSVDRCALPYDRHYGSPVVSLPRTASPVRLARAVHEVQNRQTSSFLCVSYNQRDPTSTTERARPPHASPPTTYDQMPVFRVHMNRSASNRQRSRVHYEYDDYCSPMPECKKPRHQRRRTYIGKSPRPARGDTGPGRV
ncbi:hypothetical protein C8Q73DRAFT_364233 [Cubamyces lactineus]|nr:hypothetical protein C8Q73DRAFT_364233 [Cubamyces lactineus]